MSGSMHDCEGFISEFDLAAFFKLYRRWEFVVFQLLNRCGVILVNVYWHIIFFLKNDVTANVVFVTMSVKNQLYF